MLRGGERGGGFPVDRQRSVFVGNISYDVTEEQLRDVFSKAGTVVHLRLVHDRETGKPKGYGFAEFSDVKSAELAIRNLNGHELNGRALRVDSAAGDQNRMQEGAAEHGNVVVLPPEESPYGKECDPKDAPEVISRSVASLPPEKMFHLMKQMKEIVVSNAAEAKNMLLQNPQLAYALLQAQVVMRIVDPQVAMTMLHREQPMAGSSSAAAAAAAPFHMPPAVSQPPPMQQMQPPPHSYGRPMPPGQAPPGPSYGMPPPPSGYNQPPPGPYGGPPPPNFGAPPPGYGRAPPPAQPPQAGGYSDADRDNASLLLQVMNLTEEELIQLPAEDREKILTLRTKLRNA